MLLLLPPSESKSAPRRGKPLDLAALSFPELTRPRTAVLDALIDVSAGPDGTRRLGVGDGLAAVVRSNVDLPVAATARVEDVYSGVLYGALAAADLDPAARRRARAWVVVVSALWGAVRFGDRIPAYRLNMCGRLPGLPHLTGYWRPWLDQALPAAARTGLIVDCRSSDYATAWRPTGPLLPRTVVVRAFRDQDGKRTAVSHMAKHTRGLVVREILSRGLDPRRGEQLAEQLRSAFTVEWTPAAPGHAAYLDVVV